MSKTKVLLVGDFSGVHAELRSSLKNKGIEVCLLSDGDVYKKFPADILLTNPRSPSLIGKLFAHVGGYLGLAGFLTFIMKYKVWRSLKNYSVVQLINPSPLQGFGFISNYIFIRFLIRNNNKIFLSALGEDYYWVNACLSGCFKYSAMDNLNNNSLKKYKYSLKHVKRNFKFLNDYCLKHSTAVIPGLYDYYKCYNWSDKCIRTIPLPINENKVSVEPIDLIENEKIIIFHGWQHGKELKKGNFIFDKAIKKILLKYGDLIEYKVVKNIPYSEYIQIFKNCHIFIDQCYSYDKGMNALLGMAAGKVVFSGAEMEALNFYDMSGLRLIPLVNALPDEDYLFEKIESLILNKKMINEISAEAIKFVRKNHLSNIVLDKYLDAWGI